MVARALVLAACALALAACAGGESERAVPARVVGVVVSVEEEAGQVTSFTVEAEDGESYELFIAEDVDYGFDLRHLHEHERTGDPVRCRVKERDGRAYALEILDA